MFDLTYSCAGNFPGKPLPSATPSHAHPHRDHHLESHKVTTTKHFTFTPPTASFTFSSHILINLQTALQNGWAPTTIKSYNHHVKLFIKFCDNERIPPHRRFPADKIVLCAFATSRIGRILGNTIRNHLSGLRAWHLFHNMPWNGGQRLHYVVNGVSCLSPPSSTRPPRIPVNRNMIEILHDKLDPNSNFDAAVLACATTAFWGQC
jgi:hypothetical protein